MLLLCALMAGAGNAWADGTNVTINFGTTTGYWSAHTSASYTDSDSRSWSRTCAVSNMSGQAGYSQFGNSSNTCTSLVFTATAGSDMTVTAFSVTMAGASGGNSPTTGTIYLYKRTSGGTETQLATASVSGTTSVICSISSEVVFSSTDMLKVSYIGTAKAIRISQLSYSYAAPKTATTTSIDATGITNTQVNRGTAAGQLTATVKAGDIAIDGATVTWESSDESVATVDANGTVTLVAAGSTTITASYAGSDTYAASSATYGLTVTDSRADAELIVEDDFSMDVTTTRNIEDLYAMTSDGEMTVTSSAPTIVSVDGDKLKALALGTAVITFSVAGNTNYKADEASLTITVTTKAAVEPEGNNVGGDYSLVTDDSTLAEGDKLIIVGIAKNNDYCAIGEAQTNNFKATAVTVNNNSIAEISNTVKVITLEGETDAWYLKIGTDSYLYAASNSSNHMKAAGMSTVGNNGKAEIKINSTSGAAAITFQGSNSHNVIRCNQGSSNSGTVNDVLFSCYTSGQTDIYIYRQNAATSFDVTIGSSGWRTLVSAQNVSLPSGVKAYTITASSASSATLTEVASVKANNPYLLNGPAGDCTLTIIDTPTEPTGNLLQVSSATTGNGVYVLANKSNGVGFYKWDGGSLGAGRVYLPAPAAGAREFISFDDEATGVSNVNINANLNLDVYDLQGRRVAQPSKGLYIINGKKVAIK